MMTMLKGRRIGLAAKVNALIVGSILATVLGTGALTLRNMTAESFQQLLSDGATLAAMISQNSEYAIYTENHDALMQAVQGLKAYPSVAYVPFLLHAAWSAAVCVLLFVAATILLMRRITAPIRSLVQATHAVAEGRLDIDLVVRTHDEVEDLAVSFGAMVQQLRKSRQEVESYQHGLEEKVERRTHELEIATQRAYELARQAEE